MARFVACPSCGSGVEASSSVCLFCGTRIGLALSEEERPKKDVLRPVQSLTAPLLVDAIQTPSGTPVSVNKGRVGRAWTRRAPVIGALGTFVVFAIAILASTRVWPRDGVSRADGAQLTAEEATAIVEQAISGSAAPECKPETFQEATKQWIVVCSVGVDGRSLTFSVSDGTRALKLIQ